MREAAYYDIIQWSRISICRTNWNKRMTHKPLALIILDGWGESQTSEHNPIKSTATPVFDQLMLNPHTLLQASGRAVGLPEGQMGNSEVGHLHLGSGRLLQQDLVRISDAVDSGRFDQNPSFIHAINFANKNNKAVHILGLLSPGGVHSHEKHIYAMIHLCSQHNVKKVYVHAILDGRDTPPKSALNSLQTLERVCKLNNEIGRASCRERV